LIQLTFVYAILKLLNAANVSFFYLVSMRVMMYEGTWRNMFRFVSSTNTESKYS